MSCLSKYTRHTGKQYDNLFHIQVSKKPVAAFAFLMENIRRDFCLNFWIRHLKYFSEKVVKSGKNTHTI